MAVRDELVLGMPHLGPHALGEVEMLKHLGHLRWQSFQNATGVPTHLVVDAGGRRLYATFFHGHIQFPLSAPPHAFRENDRVVWVGDLAACGRNILDGHFALYRGDDPRAEDWGVPDEREVEAFVAGGVPVVRLSNIFIAQEAGPDSLRIGQPANADFARVRARAAPPDGHARNLRARETGRFFDPPPGAVPIAATAFAHRIDPDRDVNAVGLVYFANFAAFFAAAERHALDRLPNGGLPRPFVDRRATVRRRVGWFANASADDFLAIEAACAILPEPVEADTPPRPHGWLWFTVRVTRASDSRLIAITTADRIAPLPTPADVELWREYAGTLASRTT